LRVLYTTIAVVILDQITKFLVKGLKVESLGINIEGMPYGSSKELLGNFVRLTYIENPGMAFGLDVGPKMFLTIFTILASFLILYYIFKHRQDGILIRLALAFILAGAVGNLIDRTFYGELYGYASFFQGRVVDFVQVEFWDFTFLGKTYTTWPIFNVADVSVTVGFLIIIFFHKRIFKSHELEETPFTPDSYVNIEETKDSIPQISRDFINSQNGSGLENTEENPSSSSSGTEEAENR
jgi:signal peptidase II